MKIKQIELFPIRMKPVKTDWGSSQVAHIPGMATVILRITTDSGVVGLGEAASGPAYFNQTLGSLLDWLRNYSKALQEPLKLSKQSFLLDGENSAFPRLLNNRLDKVKESLFINFNSKI